MTEKRANEILRTKYPEATIFRRNSMGGTSSSRLAVTFVPNGKVYDYAAASYQQVLEKLGFNILYKHNVKCYKEKIEQLEAEIEAGGETNIFAKLFGEDPWHTFTDKELADKRAEIDHINEILATAIID